MLDVILSEGRTVKLGRGYVGYKMSFGHFHAATFSLTNQSWTCTVETQHSIVFFCPHPPPGPRGWPRAAVDQSHHRIRPGHAQEGPAHLARQPSEVRLRGEHQER